MLLFLLLLSISWAALSAAFSRFSSSRLAFCMNSSKSRFSPASSCVVPVGLMLTVATVVAVLAVEADVNILDRETLSMVGEVGAEGEEGDLDDRLRWRLLKNISPI